VFVLLAVECCRLISDLYAKQHLIAIGIVSFVVAYGLLKGMGLAWTLTVVLSIIIIALNAISIASGNVGGIVSIIISAVILYYLYRPYVKAYFGKGVTPASTFPT
jgi:hypothetical protein